MKIFNTLTSTSIIKNGANSNLNSKNSEKSPNLPKFNSNFSKFSKNLLNSFQNLHLNQQQPPENHFHFHFYDQNHQNHQNHQNPIIIKTDNENSPNSSQSIIKLPSKQSQNDQKPKKTQKKSKNQNQLTNLSSPSSSSSSKSETCSGITLSGRPCSRKPMKSLEPLNQSNIKANFNLNQLDHLLNSSSHSINSNSTSIPKFCFQHHQKVNDQSGAFFGNSIWINFSDWIANQLPQSIKLLLKIEMSKEPTQIDHNQLGYIYCYEIKPSSNQNPTTFIKLGRSIKPIARLSQWAKQCPSRQPILRGFFPQALNSSPHSSNLNGTLSLPSNPIKFHHRWERLCLIELSGWAFLQRQGKKNLPCLDCGKIHLELFELDKGSFERFIKPMIQKWQTWCGFAYL
ncbi:hypothetical protein O181_071172 [Austropuccinia psidii MF-1]|uniref:Bacteriophage T5 Orf172 DNA-binding domain-containing protein n=1 Tax=Austropuccinia psidii MF-1 TaxID=1389203 RepID=A0A9Q3F4N9_9BASI|nr:hypothetical protein [Austropuccinia psidii MF-1]